MDTNHSDFSHFPHAPNATQMVKVEDGYLSCNSSEYQVGVQNTYVQMIFGIAYATVWFVSVLSNVVTLVVVFSVVSGRGPAAAAPMYGAPSETCGHADAVRKKCHSMARPSFTVRTIFVGALACSDLLAGMTSLPVTAFNLFNDEWPFPDFVCPGVGFLQAFSIFMSSFTFTAIAVDRFLLIVQARAFTYKMARAAVITTALLATLLSAPMFTFVKVDTIPNVCGRFCMEIWPAWAEVVINRRIYGLFVLTLQFGLPTIVTTVCYITIGLRLQKCQTHRLETTKFQPKSEKRSNDRRKRANGMMISMVTAFTVLWTPLNAINISRDFEIFPYFFDWSWFSILYAMCHLIAMTTLVWNPVIYAWYNRSIREAVVQLFRPLIRWSLKKKNRRNRPPAGNGLTRRRGSAASLVMAPAEGK